MMTDKQQIEKFAKDLCKACRKSLKTCECKTPCVKAQIVSEALYNAGYRKVPENAVVLTREEFDRLNSCIKSEEEVRAIMQQQKLPMVRELTDKEVDKKLATVTALVCKKTAKEILQEFGYCNDTTFYQKWLELCKKYGVEVEE